MHSFQFDWVGTLLFQPNAVRVVFSSNTVFPGDFHLNAAQLPISHIPMNLGVVLLFSTVKDAYMHKEIQKMEFNYC